MTLIDQLIASRDEGGAGIMLVSTPNGMQYVGLDAADNIITLDPATVIYGAETGLRLMEVI